MAKYKEPIGSPIVPHPGGGGGHNTPETNKPSSDETVGLPIPGQTTRWASRAAHDREMRRRAREGTLPGSQSAVPTPESKPNKHGVDVSKLTPGDRVHVESDVPGRPLVATFKGFHPTTGRPIVRQHFTGAKDRSIHPNKIVAAGEAAAPKKHAPVDRIAQRERNRTTLRPWD